MKDDLVVCVPVYGAVDYAVRTIETLCASTNRLRGIVVVDDCSPEPGEQIERAVRGRAGRCRLHYVRHAVNRGLTAAWNTGFSFAVEDGACYYAPGNSDLLFPEGAVDALCRAVEAGYAMAGPLTNAPGHVPAQDIRRYVPDYRPSDEQREVERCMRELGQKQGGLVSSGLNGFFMLGSVSRLLKCRHSSGELYNPAKPMVGNEDELLARMRRRGYDSCIATTAFVFHYRSVSRGLTQRTSCRGAYRK